MWISDTFRHTQLELPFPLLRKNSQISCMFVKCFLSVTADVQEPVQQEGAGRSRQNRFFNLRCSRRDREQTGKTHDQTQNAREFAHRGNKGNLAKTDREQRQGLNTQGKDTQVKLIRGITEEASRNKQVAKPKSNMTYFVAVGTYLQDKLVVCHSTFCLPGRSGWSLPVTNRYTDIHIMVEKHCNI